MASQTYAAKRAALDTVLGQLDQGGDFSPGQLLPEAFTDTGDLLVTAHQRWHRHLGARVDAALESGDAPTVAVGSAYRETIRAMPDLRRLLDHHAGHPALETAEQRELSLLAWAAGLATPATPARRAADLGREFRDAVSAGVPTRRSPVEPGTARGWLRRLKDAVAV